jgi:hypothetical protein
MAGNGSTDRRGADSRRFGEVCVSPSPPSQLPLQAPGADHDAHLDVLRCNLRSSEPDRSQLQRTTDELSLAAA